MGMGMAFAANNAYEKIGEDISLSDVLHTAGAPTFLSILTLVVVFLRGFNYLRLMCSDSVG